MQKKIARADERLSDERSLASGAAGRRPLPPPGSAAPRSPAATPEAACTSTTRCCRANWPDRGPAGRPKPRRPPPGRGFGSLSDHSYRLLPAGRHLANVNDVAAAIAWVHDHAAENGIDPDAIFVMGHSAGAHLAALVATNPAPLRKAGEPLGILKAAIPVDTMAYDIPGMLAANPRARPSPCHTQSAGRARRAAADRLSVGRTAAGG